MNLGIVPLPDPKCGKFTSWFPCRFPWDPEKPPSVLVNDLRLSPHDLPSPLGYYGPLALTSMVRVLPPVPYYSCSVQHDYLGPLRCLSTLPMRVSFVPHVSCVVLVRDLKSCLRCGAGLSVIPIVLSTMCCF